MALVEPETNTPSLLELFSDVAIGQNVGLEIYGDRMEGRFQGASGDTFRLLIPARDQVEGLHMSTAHGTVTVPVKVGAAVMPVSCWATGDTVRLQIIGPVTYIQRRLHARRALNVPVTLCWPQAGAAGAWERVVSHTVDISQSGMQVGSATTVWPRPGAQMLVSVDLVDGSFQAETKLIGKTSDYGLRLRFVDLDPEISARIAALITRAPRDPSRTSRTPTPVP